MHDPTPVQSDMERIFGPSVASGAAGGPGEGKAWNVLASGGASGPLSSRWQGFAASTAGFVTLAFALALAGTGIALTVRDRVPAAHDDPRPPSRLAIASPSPEPLPRPSPPEPHVPAARHRETASSRMPARDHAGSMTADRVQAARAAAERLRQDYAEDAAITRRLNAAALQAMPNP